jgi:hypothetical protein
MGGAVRILARTLPVAAVLAATLAFGTESRAQLPTAGVSLVVSFDSQPSLDVMRLSGGGSSLGFSSVIVEETAPPVPPAQVTVELAPGYVASAPAPGAQVGEATLLSVSPESSQLGSVAFVNGGLTADDPARYASDPAAQACAAGPYTAVWRLTASLFGLSYVLPVFVEHPAGDTQRVELRFCPPPLTGSDGRPVTAKPVPLFAAGFQLSTITAPSGRGTYTSSALVTPQDSSGAPDPPSTVEARFVAPVPHTLTVKGRYDSRTRSAVLTGRVAEVGRPQGGATVEYVRTSQVTPPKEVRTSRKGTFTIRARITATSTFLLLVPDSTGSCPGPSTAPRGCASLTVAGTNAREVRIAVPRR